MEKKNTYPFERSIRIIKSEIIDFVDNYPPKNEPPTQKDIELFLNLGDNAVYEGNIIEGIVQFMLRFINFIEFNFHVVHYYMINKKLDIGYKSIIAGKNTYSLETISKDTSFNNVIAKLLDIIDSTNCFSGLLFLVKRYKYAIKIPQTLIFKLLKKYEFSIVYEILKIDVNGTIIRKKLISYMHNKFLSESELRLWFHIMVMEYPYLSGSNKVKNFFRMINLILNVKVKLSDSNSYEILNSLDSVVILTKDSFELIKTKSISSNKVFANLLRSDIDKLISGLLKIIFEHKIINYFIDEDIEYIKKACVNMSKKTKITKEIYKFIIQNNLKIKRLHIFSKCTDPRLFLYFIDPNRYSDEVYRMVFTKSRINNIISNKNLISKLTNSKRIRRAYFCGIFDLLQIVRYEITRIYDHELNNKWLISYFCNENYEENSIFLGLIHAISKFINKSDEPTIIELLIDELIHYLQLKYYKVDNLYILIKNLDCLIQVIGFGNIYSYKPPNNSSIPKNRLSLDFVKKTKNEKVITLYILYIVDHFGVENFVADRFGFDYYKFIDFNLQIFFMLDYFTDLQYFFNSIKNHSDILHNRVFNELSFHERWKPIPQDKIIKALHELSDEIHCVTFDGMGYINEFIKIKNDREYQYYEKLDQIENCVICLDESTILFKLCCNKENDHFYCANCIGRINLGKTKYAKCVICKTVCEKIKKYVCPADLNKA